MLLDYGQISEYWKWPLSDVRALSPRERRWWLELAVWRAKR